jgi:hypothetical protein
MMEGLVKNAVGRELIIAVPVLKEEPLALLVLN